MSTFVYGYDGGQASFNTSAPVGVWGDSCYSHGVIGSSDGGIGVYAISSTGIPLVARTLSGSGVSADLWGVTKAWTITCHQIDTIYLEVKDLTIRDGIIRCYGTIQKGAGLFKIDHPVEPENKYLCHSFVESPDMKNIYDGVATLNDRGEAVVELPDWFEPLNQDFRYQLTAMGAPGPNLHIAEEIKDNQFKIAGGQPGMQVCWQVTGIRHDAYAKAHRIAVEKDKSEAEKGLYLHPEAHGQPAAKQIRSNGFGTRIHPVEGLVTP